MKHPNIAVVSAGAVLLAALSLAMPAAQGQSVVLTWVDRTGKVIEQIGAAGPYRGLDLTPDGKKVVAHRHGGSAGDNLLFEPTGTGSGTRLSGDSSIENTPAIWSPDGTRVVYGSKRNGKGGIYLKRADNQGEEELVFESETTNIPVSWSPDGKFVVYWVQGGIEWILPLTGDRKPFQLSEGPSQHAQISPDGKWVAYSSSETGRMEIYIKAFPPGPNSWRVSKEGGEFARWRGDSGELYWLSKVTDGKMMAVEIRVTGSSIQAGAPRELFDSGYTNFNHPNGGIYHTYAVARDGQRFLIPRPEKPATTTAENLERNGRTLVLYDRQGTVVGTVGERALYGQAALSPDRTRIAVTRNDPEKGIQDIWVLDIATGKATQITASKSGEPPRGPVVWSPDGTQIGYISSRSGTEAIYRKAASGQGDEELLAKLTGSGINLRDWTADGRYITYYSEQLGGSIVFAIPLEGERTPIAAARSQFPMVAATVSPNGRFLLYRSNETGRDEIYVQPFSLTGTASTTRWKVSPDGGVGPLLWRADGKELYFVGRTDRTIMAVDVNTETDFEFGKPRPLVKAPDTLSQNGLAGNANVSRDGERIVLIVPPAPPTPPPPPPMQQISVFDREGKVVKTIGQPARYNEATLSPDGTRIAVLKAPAPNGGNDSELWSYDVVTGEGRSVAKGNIFAILWSPDGSKIFYVSNRPGAINVLCRRAGDGSGSEEELFRQTAGYPLNITDISSDGKFLSLDIGGVIAVLPLAGNDQSRQLIEFSREEYFTGNGRFSESGRFMAFMSNETGRSEIYARAVDANGAPSTEKWKVTPDGVGNMANWKADNSELYYYKNDFGDTLVMALDITTAPVFKAGTPRFLFRVPNVGTRLRNISRDGQRFIFVTNVPATPAPK
jgi:Tol biopolymer transport system component